jgi:hypothetical protein
MGQDPFIYLYADGEPCTALAVAPGFEGFVLHEHGRAHLGPGVHRLECRGVAAIFQVRVGGNHSVDLRRLGGVLLRDGAGRRRPVKLLGRLVYRIERAGQLVDLLEHEQIYEPRQLEAELARLVVEHLSNVFDGDDWSAERLHESLDVARCELLRHLGSALAPLGIEIVDLELLAEPLNDSTMSSRIANA